MDSNNLKNFTDALLNQYQHILGYLDKKSLSYEKIVSTVINYYEDIILSMPGNVYWLDKNCNGIGCSKDVLDMFGFNSVSQFKGLGFEEMGKIGNWSPEATQAFKNDSLEVVKSGKPKLNIEEPPISHSNGRTIYFLTSRVPLFDQHNNVIGVVGISVDITELKSTQAALKKAKEEAEAASFAKSEFVANMSHDLKTPLSGIIGLSELLTYRLKGQENLEFSQTLLMSGRQLLNFFDNCLEVFKLETGDISLVTEYFILKDVLDEIDELFAPAIKAKELTFDIHFDKHIPHLIGSRAGVYRILLNLVGNAVKFTQKGSVTINVTLAGKPPAKEAIIKITVEDTGSGIPKDKQKVIFDRFTRLTPSYKGTYEGTGIGLYIVQKLLKTMRGEIHVESEPGNGSKFSVLLPFEIALSNKEDFSKAQPHHQTTPHKHTKEIKLGTHNQPDIKETWIKILLVEDNFTAQLMESSLLSSMSCVVDVVDCGEHALEIFEPGKYDLIFMDIGLPGIQGDAASKIIRKMEQGTNHHVPIIALTAHITEDLNNHCIVAGIEDVLSKPLSRDQAKQIIEHYYLSAK